jgi:predicted nucleotide-binding protein
MFNLIISGNPDAWEGDLFEFPMERLFEYTEEVTKHAFVYPTDTNGNIEVDWKKLEKLPTVLAYEKSVGKAAKVVTLSALRKVGKNIKFQVASIFDLSSTFDIYDEKIAFALDINLDSWQVSRTYWAINDVDLLLVLSNQGILGAQVDSAASRPNQLTFSPKETASSEVFIVHGHDEAMKQSVARFIEKSGLKTVILSEQPDHGKTVIEKFEKFASVSAYAIVLLSPDDFGGTDAAALNRRARQNVILELGYFIGRLGRERVCAIKRGEVELPSDILGIVWKSFDSHDGWKLALYRELKAAGLSPNEAALH